MDVLLYAYWFIYPSDYVLYLHLVRVTVTPVHVSLHHQPDVVSLGICPVHHSILSCNVTIETS